MYYSVVYSVVYRERHIDCAGVEFTARLPARSPPLPASRSVVSAALHCVVVFCYAPTPVARVLRCDCHLGSFTGTRGVHRGVPVRRVEAAEVRVFESKRKSGFHRPCSALPDPCRRRPSTATTTDATTTTTSTRTVSVLQGRQRRRRRVW